MPTITDTQIVDGKKVTMTMTIEDAVPARKQIRVALLIDASGSMASKIADTLGGFKTFIDRLKADTETDYRVTVTLFNTETTLLFNNVPLAELPELTVENYQCLGGTALLDAAGATMRTVAKAIQTKDNRYGTDSVLFAIFTDGEENSSRKFNRDEIKQMIGRREESGNWTFAYIGSEKNTFLDAQSIGISIGSTLHYSSADVAGAFSNLTASATAYSASGGASTRDFFGSPAAVIDITPDGIDIHPATTDDDKDA